MSYLLTPMLTYYEARLAASATENGRLRAELHAAREKLAVIGLL